jgi:hypothetical protein
MPLNSKGKKIKAKMEKQYGSKKGQSIFYAMENSGKLKGITKASKGGSFDYEGEAYGTKSASSYTTGMEGSPEVGGKGTTTTYGSNQSSPSAPQARTGPVQVPTIGPMTYAFNQISKGLYNRKNLKEARKDDVLGGEMLTTGQKATGVATTGNPGNPGITGGCADGSSPPCKSPGTQIKAPAKKNMFLSGFQSYDNGGEVVISDNVDKDLL